MHHIPGMLRSLSNALDTFNVVKALPIVDETRRYVPSSATSTQSYLSVDDQIQFQRFEECLQRVQAENRAQTENNETLSVMEQQTQAEQRLYRIVTKRARKSSKKTSY